jgi:hypothetical protein
MIFLNKIELFAGDTYDRQAWYEWLGKNPDLLTKDGVCCALEDIAAGKRTLYMASSANGNIRLLGVRLKDIPGYTGKKEQILTAPPIYMAMFMKKYDLIEKLRTIDNDIRLLNAIAFEMDRLRFRNLVIPDTWLQIIDEEELMRGDHFKKKALYCDDDIQLLWDHTQMEAVQYAKAHPDQLSLKTLIGSVMFFPSLSEYASKNLSDAAAERDMKTLECIGKECEGWLDEQQNYTMREYFFIHLLMNHTVGQMKDSQKAILRSFYKNRMQPDQICSVSGDIIAQVEKGTYNRRKIEIKENIIRILEN